MNLHEALLAEVDCDERNAQRTLARCAKTREVVAGLAADLYAVEGVSHTWQYYFGIHIYPDSSTDVHELAKRVAQQLHVPFRKREYNSSSNSIEYKFFIDYNWLTGKESKFQITIIGPLTDRCTVEKVKVGEEVVEKFAYEIHCD